MIFVWYFGFSFSNLRFYLSFYALFGFQESGLDLICTVLSFFFLLSVWFTRRRNEVQCILDFYLVSNKVKENDVLLVIPKCIIQHSVVQRSEWAVEEDSHET